MIRFDNVHKSYGDLKVLKGINAEAWKSHFADGCSDRVAPQVLDVQMRVWP